MAVNLRLTCPDGVKLSFERVVHSHGLTGVSPWSRTDSGGLEIAVPTSKGSSLISIEAKEESRNELGSQISISHLAGDEIPKEDLEALGRRLLGITQSLSGFHQSALADPDLGWVGQAGAGAMARGATAFEDVVRTILTTNCAWSSTVAMCDRLVQGYGNEVKGGGGARAFPSAAVIASLDEDELKREVRLGYRAKSLIETARMFAEGEVNLEELSVASRDDVADEELREQLLCLPGVGPYAAAHAMLLFGRGAYPVLDSWTRPKYARLTGRKKVTDSQILRRLERHEPDAGLALWLILTRDWFEPEGQPE